MMTNQVDPLVVVILLLLLIPFSIMISGGVAPGTQASELDVERWTLGVCFFIPTNSIASGIAFDRVTACPAVALSC